MPPTAEELGGGGGGDFVLEEMLYREGLAFGVNRPMRIRHRYAGGHLRSPRCQQPACGDADINQTRGPLSGTLQGVTR